MGSTAIQVAEPQKTGEPEAVRPRTCRCSESSFGVRLTLAYVCGIVLHGGLLGAWIGMCLDNTTRAVLVAWLLRRGRWMSKSV